MNGSEERAFQERRWWEQAPAAGEGLASTGRRASAWQACRVCGMPAHPRCRGSPRPDPEEFGLSSWSGRIQLQWLKEDGNQISFTVEEAYNTLRPSLLLLNKCRTHVPSCLLFNIYSKYLQIPRYMIWKDKSLLWRVHSLFWKPYRWLAIKPGT